MSASTLLQDRLASSDLPALIAKICEVSGTAGAPIGIHKDGNNVSRYNWGAQDLTSGEKPDEHTIYATGSLSKGMTAAALAVLVEDGVFEWDTPVVKVIDGFLQKNKPLEGMISVADLLAHRSGLGSPGAIWSQGSNKVHMPRDQLLAAFSVAPTVADFRASFTYCNYGYWIGDEIIRQCTKESWGTFVSKKIIEPLGLERTFTRGIPADTPNVAKAYTPLLDRSIFEIVYLVVVKDDIIIAGAVGVSGSVSDLLV